MSSYKIAKKRDRLLAFIIDFFIYLFSGLIIGYFYGTPKIDGNGSTINGFPAFILFLIGIALWPFHEAFSSQTIGKKIVGIKVVNENFKTISGTQALTRFIFGIIDCMLFLGIIVAIVSKKNQRIGDLVAKTIVIETKKIS